MLYLNSPKLSNMLKFSFFLFIFISLSITASAYKYKYRYPAPIPPGPSSCLIHYYSPDPEPLCAEWISISGQTEQFCTPIEASPFELIMQKNTPAFTVPGFELSEIHFRGDCRCHLTVYTSPRFTGWYVKYPMRFNKDNAIILREVFNQKVRSFKVECNLK